MILIMPLHSLSPDKTRRVGFDFKERLEEDIGIKKNGLMQSSNLAVKRINTIGKCVGLQTDFERYFLAQGVWNILAKLT